MTLRAEQAPEVETLELRHCKGHLYRPFVTLRRPNVFRFQYVAATSGITCSGAVESCTPHLNNLRQGEGDLVSLKSKNIFAASLTLLTRRLHPRRVLPRGFAKLDAFLAARRSMVRTHKQSHIKTEILAQ